MSDNAEHPRSKPSRTVDLSADPMVQAVQAKNLHLYTTGAMVIGGIADMQGLLRTPDVATASVVAEGFLNECRRSMRPRDAVEEMLIIQMAMVHQRIGNLSLQAADQVLTKNVAVINQAVDGACNVFRRQMLALAEYRRAMPSKPTEDCPDEFRANELGSSEETSAAVPALPGRAGVPACVGAASSAVGAKHGSANGNRQIALKAQRAEARAMQPAPPRRTTPAKRVDPATTRRRRRTA